MSEALKLKSRKNQPQGLDFSWCSIVDALQTSAVDASIDYKLKHLVEAFQLSPDLIA